MRRYLASQHKLPERWGELMSRKKWSTLSDTTLRKSAAAWHYLRHYTVSGLGAQGMRLSYGIFAKMVPDMHVLRNTVSGFVGLCLGTETWGALFWPLCAISDDSGNPCFALNNQGALEWQYFYSPDFWSVMDTCVAWGECFNLLESSFRRTPDEIFSAGTWTLQG